MKKYQIDTSDFGKHLFTILVTLISLKDPENICIDISCMQKLTKVLGMDSNNELWSKYCGVLLNDIKKDPKSWTLVSAERCIFETIVLESGNYNLQTYMYKEIITFSSLFVFVEEAFGQNLRIIAEILVNALDTEADAESRLKIFMALTTVMDNKQVMFKNANEDLAVFLETLVTGIIPSIYIAPD